MATPTISIFHLSWDHTNSNGVYTVYGQLTARFDPAVDAVATWTQASVLTKIAADGYVIGQTCPVKAGITLKDFAIRRVERSHNVFRVHLVYTDDDDDANSRPTNDERVQSSIVYKQVMAYFDKNNAPIDQPDGQHGAMMDSPMRRYTVSRIHTTSKVAAADAFADRVNSSQPITTPGGVVLSTTIRQLYFEGATEQTLDNGKFQVDYEFHKDLGLYHGALATYSLLHRITVCPFTRQTGNLGTATTEAALLKDIKLQSTFATLMADE